MTIAEKREFITDLCGSIIVDLVHSVDKTPEDWDGHELRQWIVDTFTEKAIWSTYAMRGKRLKHYKNTRLINNI